MQGKAITLQQLAELTGSRLMGDGGYVITGIADLESATAQDASFLATTEHGKSYHKAMRESRAGVVFVTHDTPLVEGRHYLITKSPSIAFQQAARALLEGVMAPHSAFGGIHPTAIVHETAQLSSGVIVGPHAVVDAHVVIGANTKIGAGCYVGPHTSIGTDCLLHPKVVIREACRLGHRVILQPGVVVGGCGFGYVPDAQGRHIKLDHFAGVIIEDDVEVGANATIDRGRLNPTRIGRGSKIDNLVMIAHGVVIGEDNIIVGQTGLAGSAKTGKHVILAGQVAVNGHISIADGVIVAAKSGIAKSITKAGAYGGSPAIPMDAYRRQIVNIGKLGKTTKENL